jgi:hypothetical protein
MIDALLELFRSNFYWIDFTIGGLTPIVVYILYRSGRIDRFVWLLFWVGFALGLTWEVPMSVLNEIGPPYAVARFVRPLPTHFSMIILMHSFWDGGLFLLGVWLVHLICGGPVFERFRWPELMVLLLWGQASELWVELTSTFGEAWAYVPKPWNPSLFRFNGHDITLMPQLIWFAAPIVFYLIAWKLRGRDTGGSTE